MNITTEIKKLIVNADDFGQSAGINMGVIRSFEFGILTSASLLARYPFAAEAATYAKNNPTLGVGIHFDLGEWKLNNGNWEPVYEVVPIEDVSKVRGELRRQLDTFFELMDRSPTHIDSHQHVHCRENLLPLFEELAGELDIPLRHQSRHIRYCGSFYGQLEDGSTNPDAVSAEALKTILSNLKPGITELACHPGLEVEINTMYKAEREQEVTALCDKDVRELLEAMNVERCSFQHIRYQEDKFILE